MPSVHRDSGGTPGCGGGTLVLSPSSLLPDQIRYGLRLNSKLGAGNFLQYAYAANANRDAPLIHSNQPFVVPGGQQLTAMSVAQLTEVSARYATWYLTRSIAPMDLVAVYCDE